MTTMPDLDEEADKSLHDPNKSEDGEGEGRPVNEG